MSTIVPKAHGRKKIATVVKLFRLFDYHVFDKKPTDETDDDSNSDSEKSSFVVSKEQDTQFTIQMFGINEYGQTCAILLTDYRPFFYVKGHDDWSQEEADELLRKLRRDVGNYYKASVLRAELVEHHQLYGFSAGNKHKFIKLTFESMSTMNKVKNLWYKQQGDKRVLQPVLFHNVSLELYESNLPPLLRYFHIHQISPSGWVRFRLNDVASVPVSEKTTTCTFEYRMKKAQLEPMPEKETRVPYKICSFDIEASSSHGDFPVPIKSYKRLATNMVDLFTKVKKSTELSDEKTDLLLQRMILTAFGHDRLQDIDVVYPKHSHMITKQLIQAQIQKFLTFEVSGELVNATLTISSVFENIVPNKFYGDNEDNDDNDDNEDNDDNDDNEPIKRPKNKLPVHTVKNVFVSDKLSRDEKILQINEALTDLLPPLEGDKVTFIGSTFVKYGEPEPYLNHCLVLSTCDAVPNVDIVTMTTERELLVEWAQLMQREDPDIIIGYNIFGFDYEFMFRRAQENDCDTDFLQLSRIRGEICAQVDRTTGARSLDQTKIVLATGEYDLRYPKINGRLQIDMYTYFRRDFNLASYKLDDVAGQFISDDVKHVICAPNNETHLYTKNIAGLHAGDYIHIELSGFTSDYYRDGHKFPVKTILSNVTHQDQLYQVIVIEGHEEITSSNIKWTMAKDDVSPQDIFRLTNGTATDRAKVAKYCVQDCNLVHHLFQKTDVLTGYIEMSRICSVPIRFLVFRGQGIKLTSFVAKKCREKNTLMPDLEKAWNDVDGYEGAIVLAPKCNIYMDNPVACVDYSSLYPSSMISQNLSHDSKVWAKEYDLGGKLIAQTGNPKFDHLPEYQYIDIEFDTFKYLKDPKKSAAAKAVKTKVGKRIVRWAQLPHDQKSIMPAILEELLKARSDTRKLIKNEADPFMQNILDKRQLGYKVTANSLYGQCGAKTSTFYEKDVAACTTATGRMMIIYAKTMIEEVYGDSEYTTTCHGPVLTKAEYVYGDSVAEYTPVYVRVNNQLVICTVEELAVLYGCNHGEWLPCLETGKQEKQVCPLIEGVDTWTEQGWTKLHRVIRHTLSPDKRMIRVLTHTGLVDVTDDHSLILSTGMEIRPTDVTIGTELLHHTIPTCELEDTVADKVTEEEAMIMGFFFGDGSCGNYVCNSGKKASWALNNASVDLIDKYVKLCKIVYPYLDWKVLDTLESSHVYKIVPNSCGKYGSISEFVKFYRQTLYYKKSKIIPNSIISGSVKIRQAFWNGLYDADGDKDAHGYVRIDQKNQISASQIQWLSSSLGWNTSINTRSDKPNIYRITMTKKTQRKNPTAVKKIHTIAYHHEYVYDLTTDNHHFAAGVGNMIVHNTDSVFFTFNLQDPVTQQPIIGKKALEITIEIAQDAAHLCTQYLKAPMELSYEKTLMPFILLSKKRYVGMLYETNPDKGKLKYMGLSLKRRDSCDYLKDVYGGILTILMNETKNVHDAVEFLDKAIRELIAGNVPMDKLTITKALRGYYKNPDQMAHNVLAERIGQRDPGNKPKPGDRMKFVHVVCKNKKALQGEKIETTQFIVDNKLVIDYSFYITNQLMKPLQQLFGLALDQLWKNKKKGIEHKRDMQKLLTEFPDTEMYNKKREKACSQKVKALLFDKYLIEIEHRRNGQRMISF